MSPSSQGVAQSQNPGDSIGEIGVDMTKFPTPGYSWLQRHLAVAAMSAARTKGTYLASQYHRLSARWGKMRARKAGGHTILIAALHVLSDPGTTVVDLGPDWFDRRNSPELRARRKLSELQALGF